MSRQGRACIIPGSLCSPTDAWHDHLLLNFPCVRSFEAASSTVAQLKSAIWELFNRIGCNTPAVRALLGNEGAVTENNLLAHLGIIEQRTNELLQVGPVQLVTFA